MCKCPMLLFVRVDGGPDIDAGTLLDLNGQHPSLFEALVRLSDLGPGDVIHVDLGASGVVAVEYRYRARHAWREVVEA